MVSNLHGAVLEAIGNVMIDRIPRKLQTTLLIYVSFTIFIVISIATIVQIYILSRSLNDQLQDKAELVSKTLEVGIREVGMFELSDKIEKKLKDLRDVRPDIVEIDVVFPSSDLNYPYQMLASTGTNGEMEAPDRFDIEVMQTNRAHTTLEIVERKSGKDIVERHTNSIGFIDIVRALINSEQLYVWEITRPIHEVSGQTIGAISIEISMDEALMGIKGAILNSVKVFFSVLILILLIVLFWQRAFFVQPLYELNRGIELARSGDFTHPLTIKRNDEFGYLARAYNDMISNLNQSRANVEEINRSLQQRVEQATSELQESNNLLSEKFNELKFTQQKLISSERYTASALMAAGIAHEIRNPLHAIKTAYRYIQEEFLINNAHGEPRFQELNRILSEQIAQIEYLVSGFLDYTRPVKLKMTHCSIQAVVQEALRSVLINNPSNGIDIEEQYDEDVPMVIADLYVLKNAFNKLLQNSIYAMPSGGELSVKLSLAKGLKGIEVIIKDTGVGIDEKNLPEIFEPFYSTNSGAIGLGLTVAQCSIEAHGGNIYVYSEKEKGTTFTINLPLPD